LSTLIAGFLGACALASVDFPDAGRPHSRMSLVDDLGVTALGVMVGC
jgi:hypothetical protein